MTCVKWLTSRCSHINSVVTEYRGSVVVLDESHCPPGSSRTNLQVLVLVLVLGLQVLVLVLGPQVLVLVLVLGPQSLSSSVKSLSSDHPQVLILVLGPQVLILVLER